MRAWTLMTAMPPTKGHFNLMDFVSHLGDERGKVVLVTQPGEPYPRERYEALRKATERTAGVDVIWLHREVPQDPNSPGFWELWRDLLLSLGFKVGDIFASSETYGAVLAERLHGMFMPFDPERELIAAKATKVRRGVKENFSMILPEFQHNLLTTVTVWGAESTGKTTLSKDLALSLNGHWTFEWARPYLETVGPDIDLYAMERIWQGQKAVQDMAQGWLDKPFVIADTDLFSTIGYWAQPHWASELGEVPEGLIKDALERKSDLYLIIKSTIPFETDPLRYGGDHRESPDEFWMGIAEKYALPYKVLDMADFTQRRSWAMKWAYETQAKKATTIAFERNEPVVEKPISLETRRTMERNPGRKVTTL
jgi:NadR type nicotinamide-nucleotide adenylyltransferase